MTTLANLATMEIGDYLILAEAMCECEAGCECGWDDFFWEDGG